MGNKSLEVLQKEDLPRATCDTVGIELSGRDEGIGRRVFDKYFRIFVCPKSTAVEDQGILGSQRCISCDSRLDGLIGTFEWGLAHGEGTCVECGWPARGVHQIKDEDGEDFAVLRNSILQYHPTEVVKQEEEGATK